MEFASMYLRKEYLKYIKLLLLYVVITTILFLCIVRNDSYAADLNNWRNLHEQCVNKKQDRFSHSLIGNLYLYDMPDSIGAFVSWDETHTYLLISNLMQGYYLFVKPTSKKNEPISIIHLYKNIIKLTATCQSMDLIFSKKYSYQVALENNPSSKLLSTSPVDLRLSLRLVRGLVIDDKKGEFGDIDLRSPALKVTFTELSNDVISDTVSLEFEKTHKIKWAGRNNMSDYAKRFNLIDEMSKEACLIISEMSTSEACVKRYSGEIGEWEYQSKKN